MVDCSGFENRQALTGLRGSNPFASANEETAPATGAVSSLAEAEWPRVAQVAHWFAPIRSAGLPNGES